MSLLTALAHAYDRLPNAAPLGFSPEKIGFCIVLNPDGSVAAVEDRRDTDKKRSPEVRMVPQAVKRASGIAPNFLWDKTAYVLGITALPASPPENESESESKAREAKEAKDHARLAQTHAAFRAKHQEWFEGQEDEGLRALANFLTHWQPEHLRQPLWPDDIRDQNVTFALASEYRERGIHERPAARSLWQNIAAARASERQTCLVTGNSAPIARLHPTIKNVWGAQSSGASLVSFNLDAFESYGHESGDNAPVSEDAAFRYGTALNYFLASKDNRMQIGDSSTVFWAEAPPAIASEAEAMFMSLFSGPNTAAHDDKIQSNLISEHLDRIRQGDPLAKVAPHLAQGVRFYILGLAPNAARLSVRFWWENDFSQLIQNYQNYCQDMSLTPAPDGPQAIWRYLLELAVQNKRENIPPNLSGEWMRAIFNGTPYPQTLLNAALMRIRADGDANAWRVAMMKAVLIRNFKREAPVALDPEFTENKGYLLGRLFAVYEEIQRAALGGTVNATIKDKFYGSASASPQKVYSSLASGAQNHLSKVKKASPGRAVNLEKLIMSIMDQMSPSDDPIPAYLSPAEQAMFGLGYYHQRSDFFRPRERSTENIEHNTEHLQ